MMQFNNNVNARKMTIVRAIFRYLEFKQLEVEGVLIITDYQQRKYELGEEFKWEEMDKLERQVTLLALDEVKKLTHLDDDDKNSVWQSLVGSPVTREELGLLLKQPFSNVLCINDNLESIDGVGIFSVVC
jgi:hypothetical protein